VVTPSLALVISRFHDLPQVAKSLVRRKEFGLPRGMYLWIAYTRYYQVAYGF
jgi:hypothetical protein